MSAGGLNNLGAKSLSTPASYSSSQQQIAAPQSSFEPGSRRSGPSTPSLANSGTPRKGQASRKQHRTQRRPNGNLDDDDAMAEIVSECRADLICRLSETFANRSGSESRPERLESPRTDVHHPPLELLGSIAPLPRPPPSNPPTPYMGCWLRLSCGRQGQVCTSHNPLSPAEA